MRVADNRENSMATGRCQGRTVFRIKMADHDIIIKDLEELKQNLFDTSVFKISISTRSLMVRGTKMLCAAHNLREGRYDSLF